MQPEYQGRGFGGALLSFAEDTVPDEYEDIVLDSSLPAKAVYMKKGYISLDYNVLETENGDYLCFDSMIKKRRR